MVFNSVHEIIQKIHNLNGSFLFMGLRVQKAGLIQKIGESTEYGV